MQTAIAARFPTVQTAAPQTWKNGVVFEDEGNDTYELPGAAPGVPARIELKPRFFGLCSEVVATDKQGTQLEAHREFVGFHRVIVTKDPQSGLETVFDPKEQTIKVSTPEVHQDIDAKEGGYRTAYRQDARQELDAAGNSKFVSNLKGERETIIVNGHPMSGAVCMPYVVVDDRSFEQTELRKGEAPVTRQVAANLEGETPGKTLSASIAADGKLAVVGEDGVARTYEMFLKV